MDFIQTIILSIIEGITEFLPISSTGHLIIMAKLMNLSQNAVQTNFEITIQLASIFAVCYEYREKFYNNLELWKKIIISFIPVGVIGLLFHKIVYQLFTVQIVAIAFIVGGIIFLIIEKYYKEKEHNIKDLKDITYKQSLLIGIAQAFSLIPGTSRSGATIVGGMLCNLNRKTATEFSFLGALPVMLAATLFDVVKHHAELGSGDISNLIIGFIVSFFMALITIRLFLKYIEKYNFVPFGVYRILFGVILLVFFAK
jgi:undecaprenyl-diphosphatase